MKKTNPQGWGYPKAFFGMKARPPVHRRGRSMLRSYDQGQVIWILFIYLGPYRFAGYIGLNECIAYGLSV